MQLKAWLTKYLSPLPPGQRVRFAAYLPGKIYTTERNMSLVVAASQLLMILLFLTGGHLSFRSPRTMTYFFLYVFLLTVTLLALVLYRYTVRRKKYRGFLWLRRVYTVLLCVWVLGITFLELVAGNGLSVYYYLLPTTAAVLLLSPLESAAIFGACWLGLLVLLARLLSPAHSLFGQMVNSTFVTLLAIFISIRYYSSTVKEFLDRETIAQQYEEIKSSNALLEKLAYVDQLTGLYNRHFLHETLYPKAEQWRASGQATLCLMLDIDYFKQYNDLYGHLQGDACLQRIASVIGQCCGEGAAAIRYGGEEFLLIKTARAPFDARAFSQALLDKIKEADIPRSDVPQQRVTVSIGLWYGILGQQAELPAAIQAADDALYRAKAQGRDRMVADPDSALIS